MLGLARVRRGAEPSGGPVSSAGNPCRARGWARRRRAPTSRNPRAGKVAGKPFSKV